VGKQDELPSDIQAESAILGAIILDNDLFFEDADELTAEDFYLESNRQIFRTINDLLFGQVEDAGHADIVTICAELGKRKALHNVGGASYLASLTEGVPRRPSIKNYVQIIQEKGKLRRLARIGHDLFTSSLHSSGDAAYLLDQAERQLIDVEDGDKKQSSVHVKDLTGKINERIMTMRNMSMDKVEMELTWGIEALDQKTKGAFGGEITVLGGDSGGGKTQAALQMALENALKGIPVEIFSLEMNSEKCVQRLYPMMSTIITAQLMRDPRGMTLHTHVPELKRVAAAIDKLPIHIDDTSPLTMSRFVAKMKKSIRSRGTLLFILDYLQLLSVPGQKDLQKIESVMFGSRDFIKKKANEKRHLVLLSQFSKEQGLVKKKRRTKGDLHGGAVIHQAAQNVLLITVESPDKKEPGSNLDVEIMIEKQREGPPGKVYCQRDAMSLRYIPAAPPTEKPKNDQPKRNAEPKRRHKPDSGGEEETGSGFLRES
jgi:replicative DNA helicase